MALTITPVWDAMTGPPSSPSSSGPYGLVPDVFYTSVASAILWFEQNFLTASNLTCTITFGYGEVGNGALILADTTVSANQCYSVGVPWDFTYDALRTALVSKARTPSAIAAANTLPLTNTFGKAILVTTTLAAALGLPNGAFGSVGYVSANPSGAVLPNWIQHEICRVLGMFSQFHGNFGEMNITEMFSYSAPGVFSLAANPDSYFSLDGGVTKLADWSTYDDNFYNYNGVLNDGSFYGTPAPNATDLRVMDAIGWQMAPPTCGLLSLGH